MDKKEVYTVVAYRFGDKERHSYIVGIFLNADDALQEALKEEEFRGGKYECEIYKIPLNTPMKMEGWETIKDVPPTPHEEHLKRFALTKELTRMKMLSQGFSEYPTLQKTIQSFIEELQNTLDNLK